jgi:adenosylhomocysteine nucleosidase
MPDIALVTALERELWPLLKCWRQLEREYAGRTFRFFETANCVAVCGGMGAEAARRATQAVIALYQPTTVQSVGFAGALERGLRVGQVLEPRFVIDSGDGSRVDTGTGSGILVSFAFVAGKAQKTKLAAAYGAQAVDMEAAAVARGAEANGVRFRAVKVISDEARFPWPDMESFAGMDGRFRQRAFALHAALRPWLWATVLRLGWNCSTASRALSRHLEVEEQTAPGPPASHGADPGHPGS